MFKNDWENESMIKILIAFILLPSLLLGSICIISMQTKVYIWAVILLIAIITTGAIVVSQIVKSRCKNQGNR